MYYYRLHNGKKQEAIINLSMVASTDWSNFRKSSKTIKIWERELIKEESYICHHHLLTRKRAATERCTKFTTKNRDTHVLLVKRKKEEEEEKHSHNPHKNNKPKGRRGNQLSFNSTYNPKATSWFSHYPPPFLSNFYHTPKS